MIVLGVLVLLLVAAIVGGQAWLRGKVEEAIAKPVGIGGVDYSVSAERVKVNLPGRSLLLENAELRPVGGVSDYNAKMEITAGEVYLRGIFYKKGDDGDKPSAGARALEITAPVVRYEGVRHKAAGKRYGGTASVEEAVGEKLSMLSVDKVFVNGGSLTLDNWKAGEKLSYTVDGINLRAEGFRIGGGSSSEDRIFFSDDVTVYVNKFAHHYKEGALAMEMTGMRADTRGQKLSLDSFKVLPQYPRLEYASRVFDHTDWTQFELGKVSAVNLDFGKLVNHRTVAVDSIIVESGSIESYKDRNVPPVKVIPMLYQSVQRVPMALYIPKVSLADIDILYSELAPGADAPGSLTVSITRGHIYDLTNRAAKPDQTFRLEAVGKLFDSADLDAVMVLPADRSNDRWKFTGRIGEMDMKLLNNMVEPLINVRITAGRMDSFRCDIIGNSSVSETNATMIYDGLEIALLHRHDRDHKYVVLSELVNEIVIREQNPDRRGNLHRGYGEAERDPYKSQFNFIIKSIIAALKKVVI